MSARDRSLITCSALMAQGLFPQLEAHMKMAKQNGVTKDEMVELITQLAFYTGCQKPGQRLAWQKKFLKLN